MWCDSVAQDNDEVIAPLGSDENRQCYVAGSRDPGQDAGVSPRLSGSMAVVVALSRSRVVVYRSRNERHPL